MGLDDDLEDFGQIRCESALDNPLIGIIYAHQLRVSIGTCVDDLEIIAEVGEPEDLVNGVRYLPL